MAGHSKWANIQHRKGAQDAKRAKIFNKLSKEIMVLTEMGGADPNSNSGLRLAIAKAKATSMPKKNIEAAIAKASGNKSGSNFSEISYGGNLYGVAFLVKCLSDNANRVAASIQHYFSKAGGDVLGASAVNYIFDRLGLLEISKDGIVEETLMIAALEAGASDFEVGENSFFIYALPQDFSILKESLEAQGFNSFLTDEVKYFPNQEVKLPLEKANLLLEFVDKLEDDEDVQAVYHNLDPASLD